MTFNAAMSSLVNALISFKFIVLLKIFLKKLEREIKLLYLKNQSMTLNLMKMMLKAFFLEDSL
ncbi:hypothetical protein HDEF_1761 [Candidatus Hamiltonella defensa 5AT (Acyrthosiphon pisum)]|uniref:Uncharacterized protein n=1 Tax=Hamiltonella defensa subsp. Acyrthosiphon pisum (strain 5AT) TaxID=572265 RepID=C4K713_HAMD5|nr:hypothetical protein HDEF_1761 [Candidatus Hamiltonella defensa 5AT (Acyrthosiphon pisum)]